MNPFEAADEIASILPSAKSEFCSPTMARYPFQIIGVFTYHIKLMVEIHNTPMTKKCLNLMETIYNRGNTILKTAVENIFVFSIDTVIASCDDSEKRRIMSEMPIGLYTAYVNQIYKSGI